MPVLAKASHARQRDIAAEWGATTETEEQSPVVESPSIAADRCDGQASSEQGNAGWIALVSDAAMDEDIESRGAWFGSLPNAKWPERGRAGGLAFGSLTTACAAMAGLVVALLVWRTEVVRVLPQTASFCQLVGLDVNLPGVAFKDISVKTEAVEGKPVLVIEGIIVGESGKPVDLLRLRFLARDVQGADIYAWNTVLEQTTPKSAEQPLFKLRLASRPVEGKGIYVRFFSKRDIAGGSV